MKGLEVTAEERGGATGVLEDTGVGESVEGNGARERERRWKKMKRSGTRVTTKDAAGSSFHQPGGGKYQIVTCE